MLDLHASLPVLQFLAYDLFWGDILCIGGAILYGISNVGQEYLVRKNGNVEFLAMISVFATFISGIQWYV